MRAGVFLSPQSPSFFPSSLSPTPFDARYAVKRKFPSVDKPLQK